MICPSCGHRFNDDPVEGREAVITHQEAIHAYGLMAQGRHTEATSLMRTLLARPNDERENDG